MRKLILVALAAMALSSGAWASCEAEKRNYAKCLKYKSGYDHYSGYGCYDRNGWQTTLEKLRMQLEACLVERGY